MWLFCLNITHIGFRRITVYEFVSPQYLVWIYLPISSCHRKLTGEDNADAAAENTAVPLFPPRVERASECWYSHVDGKGEATYAAGYDYQPIKKLRHLLVPAIFQLVTCILNLLSHYFCLLIRIPESEANIRFDSPLTSLASDEMSTFTDAVSFSTSFSMDEKRLSISSCFLE